MQPEQKSAVRAGIFVLICGAIVITGIVLLGQRSQLFVQRYTLWSTFQNAAGLIPGAAVRVGGVSAGTVHKVQVVAGPGQASHVKVGMVIASSYGDVIRQDSVATIRTLGLLGDKYVEITLGSPEAGLLNPGQQVPSRELVDFYQIGEQARAAIETANGIAKEVSKTMAEVNRTAVIGDLQVSVQRLNRLLEGAEKGPSLAHSVLFDAELPKAIEDVKTAAKALRAVAEQMQAGKGALGQLIYGEKMARAMDDMAETTASAKSILQEIEKGKGAAHALVYDPRGAEALSGLGSASARLDSVLKDVQEGKGTLGLLIADPGVWDSLKRLLGGAEESKVLKYLIRPNSEAPAKPKT